MCVRQRVVNDCIVFLWNKGYCQSFNDVNVGIWFCLGYPLKKGVMALIGNIT